MINIEQRLTFILDKKFYLVIIVLFLLFIFIRTLNFNSSFNFSTDQALFSETSLDIWREKLPVLVGPRFSLEYYGRYMFQGAYIYYFLLAFLVAGGFDPILSSYFFMLFCALMTVPLYLGVKLLLGKKEATFITIIYTLLPYYITYTKFFWNPNFQFSLVPVLIFLMGLFKKQQRLRTFLILSIALGIVLQFHYLFTLVVVALFSYYFIYKRLNYKYLVVGIFGIILSFTPMLIFEFRNNFYNLTTLILFIQHSDIVFAKGGGGINQGNLHYFLSISFFILFLVTILIRKIISPILISITFLILLIWSLLIFMPSPKTAYGMVSNWNYLKEEKVSKIIISEHPGSFNIFNQLYDPSAATQKYLIKKAGVDINEEDYWYNHYLFVISARNNFMIDSAYEINNFKPFKLVDSWDIDESVRLYLVERIIK